MTTNNIPFKVAKALQHEDLLPKCVMPRLRLILLGSKHRTRMALANISIYETIRGVSLDAKALANLLAWYAARHLKGWACRDPESWHSSHGLIRVVWKIAADATRSLGRKLTWILVTLVPVPAAPGKLLCDMKPLPKQNPFSNQQSVTFLLGGHAGADNYTMISASFAGIQDNTLAIQRPRHYWQKMTVADLQRACAYAGMPTGGNKAALVDRLCRAEFEDELNEEAALQVYLQHKAQKKYRQAQQKAAETARQQQPAASLPDGPTARADHASSQARSHILASTRDARVPPTAVDPAAPNKPHGGKRPALGPTGESPNEKRGPAFPEKQTRSNNAMQLDGTGARNKAAYRRLEVQQPRTAVRRSFRLAGMQAVSMREQDSQSDSGESDADEPRTVVQAWRHSQPAGWISPAQPHGHTNTEEACELPPMTWSSDSSGTDTDDESSHDGDGTRSTTGPKTAPSNTDTSTLVPDSLAGRPGQEQGGRRRAHIALPLPKADASSCLASQLQAVFRPQGWTCDVSHHTDSSQFKQVRVQFEPCICLDCACAFSVCQRHPRACVPPKKDKHGQLQPHKCGFFCPWCDMPTCERTQVYSTLSVREILQEMREAGQPCDQGQLTMRKVSSFYRIPLPHLKTVNTLMAATPTPAEQERGLCDCSVVQQELLKAGPPEKIPYKGGSIQHTRDLVPTWVPAASGCSESEGGEDSETEASGLDAAGMQAPVWLEVPPAPANQPRGSVKEHGSCACAAHHAESTWYKRMNEDSTSHRTPSFGHVLAQWKDEGWPDRPLPCLDAGEDQTFLRVRYLGPRCPSGGVRDDAQFADCALKGFERLLLFHICVLHGFMAHVRGALKLCVLFFLNQSNCPQRKAESVAAQALFSRTADRVELFNTRFDRYGAGLYPESEGSSKYAEISLKGPQASALLDVMGKSIYRKEAGGPLAYGFVTEAQAKEDPSLTAYPLQGFDEHPHTLALWFWMYTVFSIAKLRAPTREQMREYCEACFWLKFFWRLRGSNELHCPYYVHLICDHTPAMLERRGSLWLFCNSASEAYNKTMNDACLHTTRNIMRGRAEQLACTTATARGERHGVAKAGKGTVTADIKKLGVRTASQRMLLSYHIKLQEQVHEALVSIPVTVLRHRCIIIIQRWCRRMIPILRMARVRPGVPETAGGAVS